MPAPTANIPGYPFVPHYVQTEAGRLHYVDTGEGPPVVMLHGNPTWSFLYRRLIRRLRPGHRCIAPDYIGFGRSDKPVDADLTPPAQAARVEALLNRLDLSGITLVVHDWGGPIGLSYALRYPHRIRRLVLMNTWMWPLDGDAWIALFSRLAGSPLGRTLITRFNAFARGVMPLAFADRSRLSDAAFRHYLTPLATPTDRIGSWAFPRALRGASDWLGALWARRAALPDGPALVVWGLRDPAFGLRPLRRWMALLPHAHVHSLPDVGHYVPEEAPGAVGHALTRFLDAAR